MSQSERGNSLNGNMAGELSGDAVDAKGFFGKQSKPPPCGAVEGSVDADEYCMAYPEVGKCYVFNHKVFSKETKLNIRNGTDADALALYGCFKKLKFDVRIFQDYTVASVMDELEKVSQENHSKRSCFVCCILTHGDFGILYAKDGKYETENILKLFAGDSCPSLAGKPKLFFFQACQGDGLDPGVTVICNEKSDSIEYRIPSRADYLVAYSTVPGYYSWRNTTNGSWFIQALCSVLTEHAKDKDLLKMLVIVNRKVALLFESNVPQERSMDMKKQVPYITFTLTRELKFVT